MSNTVETTEIRPIGCCENTCKSYTQDNWQVHDEEKCNRTRAAMAKARMYEKREDAFRMLKKKGLTLNMSNSVSGDPNMSNNLTDLVIAARRAFVPKDLTKEEKEIRYDILAKFMDTLSMNDIGCCEKDPRMKCDPISDKMCIKSPLKSISVYNDLDLEVKCIFIPPGQKIPLHDHPGMTVF